MQPDPVTLPPGVRAGTLPSGLATLDVQHPLAAGRLTLQGAQVLHWQPRGAAPVLWQSQRGHSQAGRSVRGGIPICWPWFGALSGQAAHGFARTLEWTLDAARVDTEGVQLRLGLRDAPHTRAVWDHAFELTLDVYFGRHLELVLCSRNTGADPMRISEALHTYLACADIDQCELLGLQDTPFIDKVLGIPGLPHGGALRFCGETDRVYGPTAATCVLVDHAARRQIVLEKSGSRSTVVWNPWSAKAERLGDMDAQEHRQMLCVEAANVGAEEVILAPLEGHRLTLRVSVQPWTDISPSAAVRAFS